MDAILVVTSRLSSIQRVRPEVNGLSASWLTSCVSEEGEGGEGGGGAVNVGFVFRSLDAAEQRLESAVRLQFTTRSRAG